MNLIREIKKLNLSIGEYVIFGSASLQIHNIRKANDIDIICTKKIYHQFEHKDGWIEVTGDNGEKCLHKDEFSIGVGWKCTKGYNPSTKYLIETADIIDGVPFANLDEILKWKIIYARKKDIKDITLIKRHLLNK